jgi:glycosyltransferase involved in cell wall biosynthesis
MSTPRASVILSTFDSPLHLARSLCGFAWQTSAPHEIVIADDGSGPETARVIEEWRARMKTPIRRIWQEKRGFGKCAILNRAIVAAEGDYLIFSDGDCVPHPDFVATHIADARHGSFLSGGVVRLPGRATGQLTLEDIAAGRVFDLRWLGDRRVTLKDRLKLARHPAMRTVLRRLSPTRPTFNGHNSSAWRDDILLVNGFDERMVYGGLDRDLGERLENAGVTGRSVRYTGTAIHLDHPRGYKSEAGLEANRMIRSEHARKRAVRTEFGINPARATSGAGND